MWKVIHELYSSYPQARYHGQKVAHALSACAACFDPKLNEKNPLTFKREKINFAGGAKVSRTAPARSRAGSRSPAHAVKRRAPQAPDKD